MPLTQVRAGQLLDGSITDADIAAANKDGAAATPCLRTLGTGAQQACAGDDSRLVPGVLAVARGGTGTGTAFTAGSIVFVGAAGTYTEDNVGLFWDDSANRLGLGTNAPQAVIDVVESGNFPHLVRLTSSTAGSSAMAQFRAVNDAGSFAYQGCTSPSFAGAGVLDSGVGFWISFNCPAVYGSQSAQPIIFTQSLVEIARVDTSGNWVLGGANLTPASLLDLFTGTLTYSANSSTANKRTQTQDVPSWADSTDATRKARRVLNVWDTAAREILRGEATGTAPAIGFLGAAAVARPNITGVRTGTLAQLQVVVQNLLAALANLGLVTDSTT